MSKLVNALALTTTCTALVGSVVSPAAAAAPTRPIISAHVSVSAVSGNLPVGATVSVIQYCPAGNRLDAGTTREAAAETSKSLNSRLRLSSLETWPAGTVSRFKVVRRGPAGTEVPVLTAAVCHGAAPVSAKTATGRAATDLRVWGPAPTALAVVNATVALVTDDITGDQVFPTVMRAAGVASSKGSMSKTVAAVQRAGVEEGVSVVAAVGQTSRRIPRGSYISMRNAYSYVSDLTTKVTLAE